MSIEQFKKRGKLPIAPPLKVKRQKSVILAQPCQSFAYNYTWMIWFVYIALPVLAWPTGCVLTSMQITEKQRARGKPRK